MVHLRPALRSCTGRRARTLAVLAALLTLALQPAAGVGAQQAIVSGPIAVSPPALPAAPPATPAAPAAAPAPASTPAGPAPVEAAPDDPYRAATEQMARLVGRARVRAGLLPLARSAELDQAATAQAREMAALGYMDHASAVDGAGPQTRAGRFGYQVPAGTGWLVVEVISAISDAPEGALGWWLGDVTHRGVVLRAQWREVGIGYAPGGPYGRFWVAQFGCRPNVLPPVLLDGMLSVPDEACGRGGGAFGRPRLARAAESAADLAAAEWAPYGPDTARRAWPDGRPAWVQVQDAAGGELTSQALDASGAPPLPEAPRAGNSVEPGT